MIANAFISLFLILAWSHEGPEEATKSKILELATVSLEQHLDASEYRFELEARWIPGSLLQSNPEQIFSVSVDGNIEEYTRFKVHHQTRRGRQVSNIQLKIKAEQLVPVAIDRIQSNTMLSLADFDLRWTNVRLGKDRYVAALTELNGKSIRRNILPGQPVLVHEISNPILVSPGDEIRMRYEAGTITLALNCESRQSGAAGEEIQIYCSETRKKYTVEIISTGEVQWLRTH